MNPAVSLAFLDGVGGSGELIVFFAVVLILFGPRRLPEIARWLGRTMEELRRASQDFKDRVMDIEAEHTLRPAPTQPPPGSFALPSKAASAPASVAAAAEGPIPAAVEPKAEDGTVAEAPAPEQAAPAPGPRPAEDEKVTHERAG